MAQNMVYLGKYSVYLEKECIFYSSLSGMLYVCQLFQTGC